MIKRNKVERMTIANTLLTSIYEELLNGETDDIEGLLQIAVNGQVEMNRIVFELNQLNGCEPQTETKTETQNSNLTFEKDECAKEYEELGLRKLKELRKDEPQTDCAWK